MRVPSSHRNLVAQSGSEFRLKMQVLAEPLEHNGSSNKMINGMATEPWESELTHSLQEYFSQLPLAFHRYQNQPFVIAPLSRLTGVLGYLKAEAGFDTLVDMTAVDYRTREPRFDLIYILYSLERNERIRIQTGVADGEEAPSATGVFAGCNWLEREIYDMFGIAFTGHPNLRRILLPEEWTGFPLRKEHIIHQQDHRWIEENLGAQAID